MKELKALRKNASLYGRTDKYNGHEAELNCAALPQKIRDFDEHKRASVALSK